MITSALQGGLGNQMFQIAAAAAIAWRNDDAPVFDLDNHYLPLQGRKASNYVNNIFRNVDFKENLDIKSVYREPHHHYSKILYYENLCIIGYFQSEKYFSDYGDKIKELFSLPKKDNDYLSEKYGKTLSLKTTSIHIRRGDYLQFSNIHPSCGQEYYSKAMKNIPDTEKFIIFSDDPQWCKENFRGERFLVVEGEEDYIDMHLMSRCDNNIIANSSFSWWAAWLNNNPQKNIIAPAKWFGDDGPQDEQDMLPENWTRI